MSVINKNFWGSEEAAKAHRRRVALAAAENRAQQELLQGSVQDLLDWFWTEGPEHAELRRLIAEAAKEKSTWSRAQEDFGPILGG